MTCENYSPDIQAQGDCRNCGNSYRSHHADLKNVESSRPGAQASFNLAGQDVSQAGFGAFAEARRRSAEAAFEDHDFGPFTVTTHNGWEVSETGNRGAASFAKQVFFENPTGGDSLMGVFRIQFLEGSTKARVMHDDAEPQPVSASGNLQDKYADWRLFGMFVTQNVDDPEIQNSFIREWNEGNWDQLDRDWPEWGEFVAREMDNPVPDDEVMPDP